jgi:site-specific DNA recombinase
LLSNEKYLGNSLLQKKYRNNHLEKKLIYNDGQLPKCYAEGTHDAIVDEELFAKAQEILHDLAK